MLIVLRDVVRESRASQRVLVLRNWFRPIQGKPAVDLFRRERLDV